MTVICLSAATVYCLPPLLMTANIVFSVFRPARCAEGCAAGFFAAMTEIAARRAADLPPDFETGPQNQKRGFLAALERSRAYKSRVLRSQWGSPIGSGRSLQVNEAFRRAESRPARADFYSTWLERAAPPCSILRGTL